MYTKASVTGQVQSHFQRPDNSTSLSQACEHFSIAGNTLTDDFRESIATNGPLPSGPPRASPIPQTSSVPNGRPTQPYGDRQQNSSPMSPNAQIAAQTVSSKDPKAAAQAASDMRNVVRRKLTGYVGFANLPNQWHRKSVRKGFNFNVMVVGTFKYSVVAS